LPVLFFLLQHLERDDLHGIFRGSDTLIGFNFSDPEVYWSSTEIVYANNEYRPPVGLQLPGRRPNKDDRTFLTRDNGRLAVPHHRLLLWVGRSNLDGFVIRDTARQRSAKRMPIGLTASGEIVFPIQCKEFIERQRGKAVEQK
jgi:hypothetical protein